MRKMFIATAFAIPLFLLGATPSMADTDVDLDIGIGTPGIYVNPGYDDDDDYPSRRRGRLRCGEAKQLVRERGYRGVRTIECSGRFYTFEGSRRGNRYELSVNSYTGDIRRR